MASSDKNILGHDFPSILLDIFRCSLAFQAIVDGFSQPKKATMPKPTFCPPGSGRLGNYPNIDPGDFRPMTNINKWK